LNDFIPNYRLSILQHRNVDLKYVLLLRTKRFIYSFRSYLLESIFRYILYLAISHKKHVRYIRTNNPTSAYAMHILHNKHDFGTAEETLKLLRPCHKGPWMNCWETFYMQLFHKHGTLINEQHLNDINPL
jgi:hypothetical protein